jgi:hypothetical protein
MTRASAPPSTGSPEPAVFARNSGRGRFNAYRKEAAHTRLRAARASTFDES